LKEPGFHHLPVHSEGFVMHNAVAVVEPHWHALVRQESRCGVSCRRVASVCNYPHVDTRFCASSRARAIGFDVKEYAATRMLLFADSMVLTTRTILRWAPPNPGI
jgi:hypothetical protein